MEEQEIEKKENLAVILKTLDVETIRSSQMNTLIMLMSDLYETETAMVWLQGEEHTRTRIINETIDNLIAELELFKIKRIGE